VRPEKNVAFNELVFFDLKELDEPKKDIIVTIEVPFLSIISPSGFISENLEESWVIGDTIEVLPPPSSSKAPKTLPTLPASAPALPTPRATESPEAGSAPNPAEPSEYPRPSRPSREIRGDVGEPNVVEGPRTRKPTVKASQSSYAAAFQQAFSVKITHQDLSLYRDRLPPPPRNWRELLRHLYREGFIKAAQIEWIALDKKETF
jgi:hypothetical protein